jgi:hypothetical protein
VQYSGADMASVAVSGSNLELDRRQSCLLPAPQHALIAGLTRKTGSGRPDSVKA